MIDLFCTILYYFYSKYKPAMQSIKSCIRGTVVEGSTHTINGKSFQNLYTTCSLQKVSLCEKPFAFLNQSSNKQSQSIPKHAWHGLSFFPWFSPLVTRKWMNNRGQTLSPHNRLSYVALSWRRVCFMHFVSRTRRSNGFGVVYGADFIKISKEFN